jgi:hypothetical protein
MYTSETKPLAGGLSYSAADIYAGIHEGRVEEYDRQQDAIQREQTAIQKEQNEAGAAYANYISEAYADDARHSEYLQNVKTAMLSECLHKLYKESSVTPLTKSDDMVVRNLIVRFVKENGASNLISDFATKNYVLSEISRICDKYYNKMLECGECEDKENETDELGFLVGKPIKLNNTIGTEFYEELEDLDCDDAAKMIKDRVADSVSEFIDSNLASRMEYQEVLDAAKDQIDKATTESQAEEISSMAQREIVELEAAREKSVFHCIVEALTKSVFKDPELSKRYVKEAKVDMESIVNTSQLMYTMLEMVNTTQIVNMDEKFISDYIAALQK